MRGSSLAAASFMLLTGAALAQVGRSGDGKEVPYANQLPANTATANAPMPADTMRNEAAGNEQAPSASDQKTEPATPRR